MVHLFRGCRARPAGASSDRTVAWHQSEGWPVHAREFMAGVVFLAALGLGALGLALGNQQPSPITPPMPRLQVELDSAPTAVLSALPGVGPALVERIAAARSSQDPAMLAHNPGQIQTPSHVPGLGPATLAKLRPFLKSQPPRSHSQILASSAAPKPKRSIRSRSRQPAPVETALASPANGR